MSAISDRRLADFRAGIDASPVEVACLAHELTERRAADLTSEEREALRDFRDHFGGKHYPDVINRALAALDKLLGKETP